MFALASPAAIPGGGILIFPGGMKLVDGFESCSDLDSIEGGGPIKPMPLGGLGAKDIKLGGLTSLNATPPVGCGLS
jgi:hypothetical protein